MSFERMPPRSEVLGWSPPRLADFLRKMNLSGSDKVVVKSSMNGARFLNMTENDVLKFPKLHAPLISKICSEINKKDGGRGLFNRKTTTPKFQEPGSDDDYEDPDRDLEDEEGSGGDYESPTEDQEDNDYEPNPSEGPEDFSQVVRASKPVDEGEYIDNINNHAASRGPPPSPSPRPFTPPTHLAPSNQVSSLERREKSPGRAMGPAASRPPMVERSKKPTRERGESLSPVPGEWFHPPSGLPSPPPVCECMWEGSLFFWFVDCMLFFLFLLFFIQSFVYSLLLYEGPKWSHTEAETINQAYLLIRHTESFFKVFASSTITVCSVPILVPASRNNTFPLQTKGIPPRPGIPGLPTRLTDSLPHGVPASLPQSFQHPSTKSITVSRSASSVGRSPHPTPPRPGSLVVLPHSHASQHNQDLDPSWYVGKIPRTDADYCLRKEHKDGSYLVRDSTHQKPQQPFTLMVLYQDKVYNIQIRMQDQLYLLGTGIKVHEGFSTVRAMISHYSKCPCS
ncbi:lymphocyte cytosolic protein 2-like [Gadus macrocephalus]|uniref:lymphocyte cytosolic protein 2-like n=1 Tax=Gadus macrocephalus TaxID=80720 RepID=UPI0028CB5E74|nr:lymphocyte cytosolic protein 2-like [Gadus macrocephalus]